MFLDTLDTFLDGFVELRFDPHGILFGAQFVDRQNLGEVVDMRFFERSDRFAEALVAVPPYVVVAGGVMVGYIGPLGFLCAAGSQREEQCCQEQRIRGDTKEPFFHVSG